MKRAALALAVAVAIPVAYAQAHPGATVVIMGPSNHPTVTQDTAHNFKLHEAATNCPEVPDNLRCKVVITVSTAQPVRVKAGQRKRIVRLGRRAYTLGAAQDRVPLEGVHLSDTGDKVLVQYGGRLRARAVVEAAQVGHWGDRKSRTFKFALKDHE